MQPFGYSQNYNGESYPTPTQLAKALGYLSFIEGVDTLISPYVDTDWVSPSTFLLFIDQSSLTYAQSYYGVRRSSS